VHEQSYHVQQSVVSRCGECSRPTKRVLFIHSGTNASSKACLQGSYYCNINWWHSFILSSRVTVRKVLHVCWTAQYNTSSSPDPPAGLSLHNRVLRIFVIERALQYSLTCRTCFSLEFPRSCHRHTQLCGNASNHMLSRRNVMGQDQAATPSSFSSRSVATLQSIHTCAFRDGCPLSYSPTCLPGGNANAS
jgi:hypothetical protein